MELLLLMFAFIQSADGLCSGSDPKFLPRTGYYLQNHVSFGLLADSETACRIKCYIVDNCMSYNYHSSSRSCEINDSDGIQYPQDLISKHGYIYVGTKNDCMKKPCPSTAVCTAHVRSQGYKCSTCVCQKANPCKEDQSVGMQNKNLPNEYLNASSEYNSNHAAHRGRLEEIPEGNLAGGWSADKNNQNQWLQVNLGKIAKVVRIATQGRSSEQYNQWVKTYYITSSRHGDQFNKYGGGRNFQGNSDRNTIVSHLISPAIIARYVRVHPVTWHIHISMRIELYECKEGAEPCSYALGMTSRAIKDEQITASSRYIPDLDSFYARLHSNVGAWAAIDPKEPQWIQVNFNKIKNINGIATQGHPELILLQWVKSYSIEYKSSHQMFYAYQNGKHFIGNIDANSIAFNSLLPSIVSTSIRILPKTWSSWIAMRIEIYGCDHESGIYTARSRLG